MGKFNERPAFHLLFIDRIVPWGRPIYDNGLSFLKAIGVRVHTVRYQKMRKQINRQDSEDRNEGEPMNWQSSKEYKQVRGTFEKHGNMRVFDHLVRLTCYCSIMNMIRNGKH